MILANFTTRQKGVAALVGLTLGFAFLALTYRYLSSYYTAYQQLYSCFFSAFIVSFFIFPQTLSWQKLKQISARDWAIMIVRALVYYVLAINLYREALTLTKIGNVTVMQAVPFTALFGMLFFKEKVTLAKAGLLIFAFIGVLMVVVKDVSFSVFGRGEVLALIAAILFAFGYMFRKWQTTYLGDTEITQIILGLSTVFLIVSALFFDGGLQGFTVAFWPVVILFVTALLYVVDIFFINYGFNNVPVITANNILNLELVFALALAFIFYREIPTLLELGGCVIIVTSAIALSMVNHTNIVGSSGGDENVQLFK